MDSGLKIVTIGAGHGGLIAAARLARFGYDVTLYEARGREELGHDGEDGFNYYMMSIMMGKCFSEMPRHICRARGNVAFFSPNQEASVNVKLEPCASQVIWRKPALQVLIDFAISCGVKMHFGERAIAPIVKGKKVLGVRLESGDVYTDLLIDSAGVFSPIRSNLPGELMVENLPEDGDVFYTYRAYFDLKEQHLCEFPYEIYLYHNGERGLSWLDTTENYADVMIGRVYPLSDEKIRELLDIVRKNRPWVGESIMHGGSKYAIPVRRPLPVMVAEGYAAVGDAAFLPLPMNGMGVDNALRSGCILARTIIANDDLSFKTLWKYNVRYHTRVGFAAAESECLKNAVLSLAPESLDKLFNNKVIESSDVIDSGQGIKPGVVFRKLFKVLKTPIPVFKLAVGLLCGKILARIYRSVPKEYSEKSVKRWMKRISLWHFPPRSAK